MNFVEVAALLRSLATELENNSGTPIPEAPHLPSNEIAVSPTGPLGAGKTRGWPTPQPENGEMILGYATRCQRTTDPATGKAFCPSGSYPWGRPITNSFAETMDRFLYPMDWFTQAELDQQAAIAKAQGNPQFSPG
jgi:hypothetical protein